MKQNVKRIWLCLCMAVCLFVLSGCGSAAQAEAEEEIDVMIVMTLESGASQYLDQFNAMTDEEIEQTIADSVKNKDTVMEGALKSWQSIKEDLGAFVSSGPFTVEASEDGYVARINAQFEKRNMEFSLMVDEDLRYITGMSFAPEYTVAENMTKALMNMLMGMGTVFVVLIFISWLISCFKYISVFEKNMKNKEAAKAAPAVTAPAPAAAPVLAAAPAPAVETPADDSELIAVITAAIVAASAAAGTPVSADGLVVRSIKRVPNRKWK